MEIWRKAHLDAMQMYQLEKKVIQSSEQGQKSKISIPSNLLKKLLIMRLKDKLKFLKTVKRLFKKPGFMIAPKMKLDQ